MTGMRSDEARLLDAGVRERLCVAAADLRLPRALRLTEWHRATVSALVEKVTRAVEDELRTDLSEREPASGHPALHAALTSAKVEIARPVLEQAGLHADAPLVAALIRRAEEHRRARSRGPREGALLLELIGDSDEAVAEEAMAILIAHSRRFDLFSEPAAARTELSAELEHRLAWWVAAALRLYMVEQHGIDPACADEAVVAAAERLIAGYDEDDGLESRSVRLVQRLTAAGRLDDGLVERTLSEGSLPLFVAAVAARAALSHSAVWEVLSDPRGRGPVLLLKAAEIARDQAASVLVNFGGDESVIAAQLDMFDVTSAESAREALRLWRFDPFYREALAEIAG